jgi:hypothetical protein
MALAAVSNVFFANFKSMSPFHMQLLASGAPRWR